MKTYDLEQALCDVLSNIDDESSVLPIAFRERWKHMPLLDQVKSLSDVVEQVIYDHRNSELRITFKEDAFVARDEFDSTDNSAD